MNKKQRTMLVRIVATALLTGMLILLPVEGWVRLAAYLTVYLIIGYDILWKALRGILHGRPFDENFLMAVASVGAFTLAVYSRSGDYLEL